MIEWTSFLLAMQQGDWLDSVGLKTAKQLNRMALQPLLGDKPLLSRQLFRSQSPGETAARLTD